MKPKEYYEGVRQGELDEKNKVLEGLGEESIQKRIDEVNPYEDCSVPWMNFMEGYLDAITLNYFETEVSDLEGTEEEIRDALGDV